ncbi:MAG TPA: GTP cyclohydrolase FolE2 [Rudaea sp.]|jgi:GTP cyclohydrolase I|nr:GTP cyclohydrolase FolE2 [Rudaea sp.]
MPDIAKSALAETSVTLDWVGMDEIQAPVVLLNEQGESSRTPARVAAFVNLRKPEARGIHMSRLYLHVDKALAEPLTPSSIRHMLRDFLESHAELSDRAMVRITFDHLLRRPALKSDHSGWKSYPLTIVGVSRNGQCDIELHFSVEYSSTCPASAALARQLIQEKFQQDFAREKPLDRDAVIAWLGSEQGICATPHSQRSVAEIRVKLSTSFGFPIVELIDVVEGALRTPVQTAVKREDEQEFALLNGSNLMFCEDAARRIHAALDDDERVADFWARASHLESLHPHDAVAVTVKGIDDGFRADV